MNIHSALYKSAALLSSIVLAGGYIWFRSGAPLPLKEPATVYAPPALSESSAGDSALTVHAERGNLLPGPKTAFPGFDTSELPALKRFSAPTKPDVSPPRTALMPSSKVLIGVGTVEFRETPDKPDSTNASPVTIDSREEYLSGSKSGVLRLMDTSTEKNEKPVRAPSPTPQATPPAPRRILLPGSKSWDLVPDEPKQPENAEQRAARARELKELEEMVRRLGAHKQLSQAPSEETKKASREILQFSSKSGKIDFSNLVSEEIVPARPWYLWPGDQQIRVPKR